MRKYSLLFLVLFLVFSCNRSAKEKTGGETESPLLSKDHIVGIGKIIPENDINQLSSPVNGIVEKIYKKENDSVSAGTVILELDHHIEDARIQQLSGAIATQKAQIAVDEAGVEEFTAKYANAKTELLRSQNLLEKGAETQQAVDQAKTDLTTLQATIKKLEASVMVAKSRVKEAEAALETAQRERAQKIITSPVNGKILEMTVLTGGSVTIQQAFAQICPRGKTIAICEIDESDADKISVGQKGWIREVGSTDTLSTGVIIFASSFLKKKSLFTDQSGEKEDRRVRTIKMELDQPGKLLLNARVECVFDISEDTPK